MHDLKASADKLRADADSADQIARSAVDMQKRELYDRLAAHFRADPSIVVAAEGQIIDC